jgi:Putative inner membrane protein (DUF1819)
MKAPARSQIVSSFTLIKGAMIEETYSVFTGWDFAHSKKDNLDRLRRENFIGANSITWLRDVAKVLNRRFDPNARDRSLAVLAKSGCPMEEWKPILLWHITRDEFLLRDFLINWLSPTFLSGAYRVRPEDLHDYLHTIGSRWNNRTCLEQGNVESSGGRSAKNGRRFWSTPWECCQRICELSPAGEKLPLSPIRASRGFAQPAQSP